MNSRYRLAGLAMWLLLATGWTRGYADTRVSLSAYDSGTSVSFDYFQDELSTHGSWIDYGSYGSCWVPAGVHDGWRPYEDGNWVLTDYGWTWNSNEPWGWATCHYGRWDYDSYYGWVWIPGTTWAPAWVAWQYGDGWVGWAPLPPSAGWSFSVGLSFGSTHMIRSDQWCFVPTERFCDRQVRRHVVPVSRNGRLLERTRNATRYDVRDGRPVNHGVDVAFVEKGRGRRVERQRLADAESPRRGQGRQKADSINLDRSGARDSDLSVERRAARRGTARATAPEVRRDRKEQGPRDVEKRVTRGNSRPDREQVGQPEPTRRGRASAKVQRQQQERPKQSVERQVVEPRRRGEGRQREATVRDGNEKSSRQDQRGGDNRDRSKRQRTK